MHLFTADHAAVLIVSFLSPNFQVIQQRVDQDVDAFNKTWTQYENGFGSLQLDSNYWLGKRSLVVFNITPFGP